MKRVLSLVQPTKNLSTGPAQRWCFLTRAFPSEAAAPNADGLGPQADQRGIGHGLHVQRQIWPVIGLAAGGHTLLSSHWSPRSQKPKEPTECFADLLGLSGLRGVKKGLETLLWWVFGVCFSRVFAQAEAGQPGRTNGFHREVSAHREVILLDKSSLKHACMASALASMIFHDLQLAHVCILMRKNNDKASS